MDAAEIGVRWVDWYNSGKLDGAAGLYAEDAEFQRMGIQSALHGSGAIAEFLRDEAARLPGRSIRVLAHISEGDAVAVEAEVEGFDPELQRFDSSLMRIGPLLVFLTVRDGKIVQQHDYVAGAPQRVPPVGLDEVSYQPSPQPMPSLLQHWEHTYNTDPRAMMVECYTDDGTVQAMRVGSRPVEKPEQIAMEERSAEVFPGRRIDMRRWLSTPDVIAVEFTWEGQHRRDPSRNLRTISACYLRLRDGRIAIDHTYVPTGAA